MVKAGLCKCTDLNADNYHVLFCRSFLFRYRFLVNIGTIPMILVPLNHPNPNTWDDSAQAVKHQNLCPTIPAACVGINKTQCWCSINLSPICMLWLQNIFIASRHCIAASLCSCLCFSWICIYMNLLSHFSGKTSSCLSLIVNHFVKSALGGCYINKMY